MDGLSRSTCDQVPLRQLLQVVSLDLQEFIPLRQHFQEPSSSRVIANPSSDALVDNEFKDHAFCFPLDQL